MKKLFCFLVVILIATIGMLAIDQLMDQSLAVLFIDQLLGQGDIIYLAPLTLLQLVDQRKLLFEANEKIIKEGEEGKEGLRDLTNEEKKTFDDNMVKIKDFDDQIKRVNDITEMRVQPPAIEITPPVSGVFSLLRTLRNEMAKYPHHEADAILLKQGADDMRANGISPEGRVCLPFIDHRHEKRADILAGTALAGAEIVSTDVLNLLGPLRNALVFTKVGATYLNGLIGNISIPKYAGSTAGWKGEVVASDDAAGAHSALPLSPMRITGHLDISQRYLIQDAAGAEELLKTDLVAAVAGLLESTILSKIAAIADTNPAGLLPDAGSTFNTGVMEYGDIFDIEATVDAANALEGNMAYITHPSLKGLMKQTIRVATTDSRMIMEGKELNGYPCHATSNMATDLSATTNEYGLAFANWRHLLIAQWGGIDLLVDPYTLGTEAKVRIVVNSYWDFIFRHPGALAYGSSLLA
ncbi:hypothetical protein ES705_25410 [subsurface metagenome]